MIITAKFASTCPSCLTPIHAGSKVEWTKGSKARHVACAKTGGATAPTAKRQGRNWDPDKFNGYGARKGGFRRACKTDGNCSSFGSGRSCGGHDCDGY